LVRRFIVSGTLRSGLHLRGYIIDHNFKFSYLVKKIVQKKTKKEMLQKQI